MTFKGRVKQFAVEHELYKDDDGTNTGKDPKSAPGSAGTASSAQGSSSTTPKIAVGAVDAQYVDTLRQTMDQSTSKGFREFQAQLAIFESVAGMDEAMRFRAALAALSSNSGLKRKDIIKSCQDRLQLLVGAREEFARTIEEKRKEDLGGNDAEKQSANELIEQKRREIQELTAKVQKLDVDSQLINQKLGNATTAFNSAYGVTEAEIQSFIAKVTQYLTQ